MLLSSWQLSEWRPRAVKMRPMRLGNGGQDVAGVIDRDGAEADAVSKDGVREDGVVDREGVGDGTDCQVEKEGRKILKKNTKGKGRKQGGDSDDENKPSSGDITHKQRGDAGRGVRVAEWPARSQAAAAMGCRNQRPSKKDADEVVKPRRRFHKQTATLCKASATNEHPKRSARSTWGNRPTAESTAVE
ncbi:hypothetical protein MTO96_028687 [Rhipicephalus appendiculatus]